jgi:hypothetical protein
MCMSSFIDATGRQALQRTLELEEARGRSKKRIVMMKVLTQKMERLLLLLYVKNIKIS